MSILYELFSAHAHEAEKILAGAGFRMTRCETNPASGSHCAQYTKADDALLFIWDAKEAWLRITAQSGEELFFRGGLRNSSAQEYEHAMSDAIQFMHALASPHHHDDDDHDAGCCSHHHA